MWVLRPGNERAWASYILKSASWTDGWGFVQSQGVPAQEVLFFTNLYSKYAAKGSQPIRTMSDKWCFIEGFGTNDSRTVGIDLSYSAENTDHDPTPITNTTQISIGGDPAGGYSHCTIGELYLFNQIKDLTYRTALRNFTKSRYSAT